MGVAPESRKAGLGTALLERCEVHLADLGVATELSLTTPEEASQTLARAHGFRHTNTTRISGVDPRTIEPPSAPPGVDLPSLAELDPRQVYELDAKAMLDVSTDNDETNAPMLRVNEKLGYRPIGSTLSLARP